MTPNTGTARDLATLWPESLPVAQTNPAAAVPAEAALCTRAVLIGKPAFEQLKQLQRNAPQPRMDLRYLIEGLVAALTCVAMPAAATGSAQPAGTDDAAACAQHATLRSAWLEASRNAMWSHVRAASAPDVHRTSTGTVGSAADEGATARTPEAPHRRASPPLDNSKSLHIDEASFQALKAVQGTTRSPWRLEIRYLLEGAVALQATDPALAQRLVGFARGALLRHLQALSHQPG